MKAVVIYGVPYLPDIVAVSFYDTKNVQLLSICFHAIKEVQKNGKCMTL